MSRTANDFLSGIIISEIAKLSTGHGAGNNFGGILKWKSEIYLILEQ